MYKIPVAVYRPNPGEDNTESIDESYKKLPGKEPLDQNLENQDVLANVEAFQNGKYVSHTSFEESSRAKKCLLT